MDPKKLPVKDRVKLLVQSLDGAEQTNEAMSICDNSEELLNLLLEVSEKQNLALTKDDLMKTPPIRDWVWYKNGGAILTVGDGTPRYQQDKNSDNRIYLGAGLIIALLFIFGMLTGF